MEELLLEAEAAAGGTPLTMEDLLMVQEGRVFRVNLGTSHLSQDKSYALNEERQRVSWGMWRTVALARPSTHPQILNRG